MARASILDTVEKLREKRRKDELNAVNQAGGGKAQARTAREILRKRNMDRKKKKKEKVKSGEFSK